MLLVALLGGCATADDDASGEALDDTGANAASTGAAPGTTSGDGAGEDDGIGIPATSTGSFEPPNGATGSSGTSGAAGDDPGYDPGDPDDGRGSAGHDTDDEADTDAASGESSGSSGGSTGEEPVCATDEPVTLFLSPDDSNSMSSPVQARKAILRHPQYLTGIPIRTWEFLNYYHFEYPAAPEGELLVVPSMVHDDDMPEGEYLLQIGVSSPEVTDEARPPINVTLVLDRSGSMKGEPIELLRESARAIAASLKAGDVISMVTWDTENAIILAGHEVDGPDDPMLLDAIADVDAGGGTDLHAGLVAGYDLAQSVYDSDRINRIVLISDGGANAGITDVEIIAENAGGRDADGIYMVGVGVGEGLSYNDRLMDAVTDAGKGASVFVGDADEAWKIFHENFVNTLAVAARDVQVRVDLPPGFEIATFSGEEYSADPSEIEPQHLAPNDAMVFHQRIQTCAPELLDEETTVTVTASYKDGTTFEGRDVSVTASFPELLAMDPALLRKGAAIFEYAEGLKAYIAASSDRDAALTPARTALARALEVLPEDPDLLEIQDLLDRL